MRNETFEQYKQRIGGVNIAHVVDSVPELERYMMFLYVESQSSSLLSTSQQALEEAGFDLHERLLNRSAIKTLAGLS